MEQSHWEASSYSSGKEIPISLKPKVHYHVYKSPPLVPILSRISPVHTTHPMRWIFIIILSIHLCQVLPSDFFPWGFPTKSLHAPLLSQYVLRAPLISSFLDLIVRVIFNEDILWSFSLCHLLHSPVTFPIGLNIFLSIEFKWLLWGYGAWLYSYVAWINVWTNIDMKEEEL